MLQIIVGSYLLRYVFAALAAVCLVIWGLWQMKFPSKSQQETRKTQAIKRANKNRSSFYR